MDRCCIVVAVEPRAYRELLVAALGVARPRLTVVSTEPAQLHGLLAHQPPSLVLAGEPADSTPRPLPPWVSLSPAAPATAVVTLSTQRLMVAELTFDRLLAIIDHVLQSGGDPARPLPPALRPFVSTLA